MMKIGIIGLGLIGGSMGLDLCSARHSNPLQYQVLGVSRRQRTCETAIAMGAVDQASVELSLMAQADLVFICTPMSSIQSTVEQLIPHLKSTTILTDVASVKQPIVEMLSPLWPHFIGGHPMAGTAESGIEAAQHHLFVGKPYVITPTSTTSPTAVETVTQIVNLLQATLYQCQPQDHDQAVAWISHLPVMISASLIAALPAEKDSNVVQLAQQLASSGFRDTSRVGGGNPELGVMMARYNREALLRSLNSYRETLDQFIYNIEHQDWNALEQQLIQTQAERKMFNI